ncbi:MAG: hypothetical protein ACP5U2_12575 [Bryobacteraceae bacterium]
MPEEVYRKLEGLAKKHAGEFYEESLHIHRLQTQGRIVVRDGVVCDGKTGKPFAGDIDVFEIREPVSGRPLPCYLTDHKGNLNTDENTGGPKLNPVREQIIEELKTGPFQAQHGAHMDWKYDHVPSKAHDANIDVDVLSEHQAPQPGRASTEPLVSIGPQEQISSSWILGGR